jgi:hypothetical protein
MSEFQVLDKVGFTPHQRKGNYDAVCNATASVLRILGSVVADQAAARAEIHVSPVQDLTADAVFQSTGKGAMR